MNYLITESCLVLKLKDCSELLIKTKPARFACPCAQCGGERDVFGNVYKKDRVLQLSGRSFEILKIQFSPPSSLDFHHLVAKTASPDPKISVPIAES